MRRKCLFYCIALCLMLLSCTENKPQANQEATRGTIEVEGTILDYVVEGTGQPCLVIGSSIYYPRTFSKELRTHFRFYFVDMPWFAKNYQEVDLNNYSLDSYLNGIEVIRKELGLDKMVLMGHSIHGTVALEYTKKYPEQVDRLIMIGSPAKWNSVAYNEAVDALWAGASEERKAIHNQKWANVIDTIGQLPGNEQMVRNYVTSSAKYWYDPNYDADWLWDDMSINSAAIDHLFGSLFKDYDAFDWEGILAVPILVVLGTYDYVVPYTLWEEEYAQLKNYQSIIFEKSGHTPQLEEPALFDQTLIQWLAQ